MVITMKHAAGCPAYTTHPFYIWLESNKLFAAITCIILGAIVATLGKRIFPYTVVLTIGISILFTVFSISSALGWATGILGVTLTFLLGFALAAVVSKYILEEKLALTIIITAILGGLMAGNAIYDLLLTTTGWESLIGWAVLVSLFGLASCLLAFNYGR